MVPARSQDVLPLSEGHGEVAQGGHAEYMLMNSDVTYLIPDKVSYEQAAPIFCAGYTVYSGLRWADPQPHERVAVLGIGGLGHLAVQYAKAAGFETVAISHSPDKDKMIRELGADEIVRDGKDLAAAGGADVILSTSNSTKAMNDSIQGLRPDGRLVTMGADAEPIGLSDRSHLEAYSNNWQPAKRPRVSIRGAGLRGPGQSQIDNRDVSVSWGREGLSARCRGQDPVPRCAHHVTAGARRSGPWRLANFASSAKLRIATP